MGRVGSVKIRGKHSRKRKQLERKHWKEAVEARRRKRTAVSGGDQASEGSMAAGAGSQSTVDNWLWWNLGSVRGRWRAPETLRASSDQLGVT